MNWISVKDSLPESQSSDGECNDYYLIWVLGYGPKLAMYMDEDWYTAYTSMVVKEVTHWCEIYKPNM